MLNILRYICLWKYCITCIKHIYCNFTTTNNILKLRDHVSSKFILILHGLYQITNTAYTILQYYIKPLKLVPKVSFSIKYLEVISVTLSYHLCYTTGQRCYMFLMLDLGIGMTAIKYRSDYKCDKRFVDNWNVT